MKIALGTFARTGIESQFGPDVRAGALAALAHYRRRLESEWRPIGPPALLWAQPGDADDSFELTLEAETEAVLQREAERHQVPIDRILVHAVLTYLADMDGALLAAPGAAGAASETAPL